MSHRPAPTSVTTLVVVLVLMCLGFAVATGPFATGSAGELPAQGDPVGDSAPARPQPE